MLNSNLEVQYSSKGKVKNKTFLARPISISKFHEIIMKRLQLFSTLL